MDKSAGSSILWQGLTILTLIAAAVAGYLLGISGLFQLGGAWLFLLLSTMFLVVQRSMLSSVYLVSQGLFFALLGYGISTRFLPRVEFFYLWGTGIAVHQLVGALLIRKNKLKQ